MIKIKKRMNHGLYVMIITTKNIEDTLSIRMKILKRSHKTTDLNILTIETHKMNYCNHWIIIVGIMDQTHQEHFIIIKKNKFQL